MDNADSPTTTTESDLLATKDTVCRPKQSKEDIGVGRKENPEVIDTTNVNHPKPRETPEEIATKKAATIVLQRLKNNKKSSLTAVTKKGNQLTKIMENPDNLHLVKDGLEQYNRLTEQYQACHLEYLEYLNHLSDEEELHIENKRLDDKLAGIVNFKTQMRSCIYEQEKQLAESMSDVSVTSSKRSHRSSSSRVESKAKLAELLVEKKMLQVQQQLQQQQKLQELQQQKKLDELQEQKKLDALQQKFQELQQQKKLDELQEQKKLEALQQQQQMEELQLNISIAKTKARNDVYDEDELIHEPSSTDERQADLNMVPAALQPPTTWSQLVSHFAHPIYSDGHQAGASKQDTALQSSTIGPQPSVTYGAQASYTDGSQARASKQPTALQSSTIGYQPSERYGAQPSYTDGEQAGASKQPTALHSSTKTSQQPISLRPLLFVDKDRPQPAHSFVSQVPSATAGLGASDYTQQPVEPRHTHTAPRLPSLQIPTFSGNVLEYQAFIMAFDVRISPRISNSIDKLYYLDQHLTGDPKELIGGCLYMDSEEGYRTARYLLDREYGDSYKASAAHISKALAWPQIKSTDSVGLKKYSYYLTKCFYVMQSIEDMTVLNHVPNIQCIIRKLPLLLQTKWNERAVMLRHSGQRINFEQVVKFIDFESQIGNDAAFGQSAMNPTRDAQKQNQHGSSFSTEISPLRCIQCEESHDLDDCKQFREKTIEEKQRFIREHHLCFGCYGVNHISRDCKERHICKICNRKHPTALHEENFKLTDRKTTSTHEVTSKSTFTTGPHKEIIMQPILPVIIQHGDGEKILTYALLDSGSTGCFISNDLHARMNGPSTEVTLKIRTMHGTSYSKTNVMSNLVISDMKGRNTFTLPKAYVRDIPVSKEQIPRPELLQQWVHLKPVLHDIAEFVPDLDIGILIGNNCPLALQPMQVIPTKANSGPYAVLYKLGWTINGPLKVTDEEGVIQCHRVIMQEMDSVGECLAPELLKVWDQDFVDITDIPGERGYSREDNEFLEMVESGIVKKNGHYVIPLPLRSSNNAIVNNRYQAQQRLMWQRKKMERNSQYHRDYTCFMNNLLEKGYAYPIPKDQLNGPEGKVWYLPHHGIYHQQKNKLRVVFDCSATYRGVSLNGNLLQGPDMTNSLIGVLTRFRQGQIAFMGDIESMFYQVRVPPKDHDYLRFLWWPNGDCSKDVEEYRMSVHIFGAVSSPSISNLALKRCASEAISTYDHLVTSTILNNFYVDDCLKSVPDEQTAIQLIKNVTEVCAAGGFRLTKFTSNSKTVMESIPVGERSKEMQEKSLVEDKVCTERALGMKWTLDTDALGFHVTSNEKPNTRRGILSMVSSVYDPLGFVAPFVLTAKKILQELCREQITWDDSLPEEYHKRWLKWRGQLKDIEEIVVHRCLHPGNFGSITSTQIHVFSDACSYGYGSVAFLRLVSDDGTIHTAFLMGKSRVAPLKATTIPRLELTAATVSVKLGRLILKELDMDIDSITYHTDSTTVLHSLNNKKKRFPVFVANRIAQIQNFSNVSQWRYIESKANPADAASRGLESTQLKGNTLWFNGPPFLRKSESEWPKQPSVIREEISTCTTAEAVVHSTEATEEDEPSKTFIEQYSSWYKLCRAVTIMRRFGTFLQGRSNKSPISVDELEATGNAIIRYTQHQTFHQDILKLQNTKQISNNKPKSRKHARIPKASALYRLDPFICDATGLLKVGGRLKAAYVPDNMRHPVLLPKTHHITTLIIRDTHRKLGHSGRNHVLAKLRERFWVIKGNAAVRSYLSKCFRCRKFRAPVSEQVMANLPAKRVEPSAPFTYTGVDLFGPYHIKEGRKQMKRYGCMFTCFVSRAVHIETVNSLETDSFINALRRFTARRGAVKMIQSDNGTNFVGAERVLREAVHEMDNDRIRDFLLKNRIDWKFNPPAASHMGGIWERMIRSARNILSVLLAEHGDRLDDEALRTLLSEVEAIINSRPLTPLSSDPDDFTPLSPSNLLTMKSTAIVAPPGQFQREDIYMRQRWRRVQYLANVFWSRWKSEYLVTLQGRQKWNTPKRNIAVGDIVLLKDEGLPRCAWNMGRITSVQVDSTNLVRKVTVKTQTSELKRPIHKLVLLLEKEKAVDN
jgi:hypothetical protein